MAINYFIGWSIKDLEDSLREAQEDLAAGKSSTLSQAGDAKTEAAIAKSAEERIRMILRALNLQDPEKYPIADITAATSTRISFA